MAVGGDLTIAEKRREMKIKGEKERYTHLNAEFQRIARNYVLFLTKIIVFSSNWLVLIMFEQNHVFGFL